MAEPHVTDTEFFSAQMAHACLVWSLKQSDMHEGGSQCCGWGRWGSSCLVSDHILTTYRLADPISDSEFLPHCWMHVWHDHAGRHLCMACPYQGGIPESRKRGRGVPGSLVSDHILPILEQQVP